MLQQEGSVLGQASSWQGAAGPACLFFFFMDASGIFWSSWNATWGPVPCQAHKHLAAPSGQGLGASVLLGYLLGKLKPKGKIKTHRECGYLWAS